MGEQAVTHGPMRPNDPYGGSDCGPLGQHSFTATYNIAPLLFMSTSIT